MIKIIKKKKIIEAYTKGDVYKEYDKPFQVGDEKELHDALIDMLYNTDFEYGDYQYPNFAEILKKYKLRIVPLEVDPKYTASISYDSPYVNVGEGCINDPTTFYQLIPLIRHELSHNLMMHEIRLADKIQDKIKNDRFNKSGLLHTAFNWIMDFEISNEVYTEADKEAMREFKLNGKTINCLITEDLREDWRELTLEQMYDKLTNELEETKRKLINNRDYGWRLSKEDTEDNFFNQITAPTVGCYLDINGDSFIWEPIEEFIEKSKSFKKFAPRYKTLLKDFYNYCKDKDNSWLTSILRLIANSDALKVINIDFTKPELDLYTPEDKNIANNVLKYLLGRPGKKPDTIKVIKAEHSNEYKEMYNEIIKKFGKRDEYTAEEIVEILNKIKK